MIKVMNIISDTNIGGAGRALLNYLRYADRACFDISVVLPRGSALLGRLNAMHVKTYEIDGMADKSLDFKAIGKLKEIIRREEPEIVHTHGSLSGRIAGRQCGKKVIFTRHSAFPFSRVLRRGPGRLVNKFINEHYADRIIAISPAGAQLLTDAGISQKKIDVMMNGTEPLTRVSDVERRAYRARFGIGDDDFTLGILARVEEYKGHLDIIEAVKRLSNEGRNVKLLIGGTGSFEKTVERRVKDFKLESSVSFCGFVDDVAAFMSAIDLQLNASYVSETSSLSLIEGMSIGVPCVASNCCGNPYLVENGVNGYLFKARDSASMARCIARVLDDRSVHSALSAGAEKIYAERFTGRKYAGTIEGIYCKALEGRYNG